MEIFVTYYYIHTHTLTSLQKGELEVENWPQDSIFFQLLSTTAPREKWLKNSEFVTFKCQRPYHVEYTSSRPITEVKQRWVQSVLGWVTAWEHWMLLASLFCPFYSFLSTLLIHFRPPSPVSSPKTSRTFSLLNDFFLTLSFFLLCYDRWKRFIRPNFF